MDKIIWFMDHVKNARASQPGIQQKIIFNEV